MTQKTQAKAAKSEKASAKTVGRKTPAARRHLMSIGKWEVSLSKRAPTVPETREPTELQKLRNERALKIRLKR